ncbi:histidinol-phosphate aminotransferase [Roseobacter cerasinus]|uniref:Histidinol-phosphate aminotransferase n=1 Tax=Roseobacter cerasinus TaxID=2602289 RepID=A0A640VX09_9RHOB|nr:histidinol-phosphate transaminase [Roseobacter cerasinus]GFE52192.1 histidinol-phosphate aminotransferase [Roseobacter cerasinus]
MTTALRAQPGIMDIALYQGGASKIVGQTDPLKLSSNENPFGSSPVVAEAIREAATALHRYPSTDHTALRAAIADVHGLDAERIICGVGSDEVLTLLAMAFAGPGDEVLYTEHGFSLYRIFALSAGATPVVAPERDRRVDVDALIERITPATRLIYIANPGNPTGTALDLPELTRLADAVPQDCLLVLDGAYAEFYDSYDGGAALVTARENVVMTRTFSKLYGLGGLRVGWGYATQHVIDVLNRIRGPFNMSVLALAGATAAMKDRGFVEMCLRENAQQRARLIGGLRQLGIACDESHANFVMARFADETTALAADAHLKAAGILVRLVKGYGFPEALRITVGSAVDVTRVLEALASFQEAS